MTTDKYERPAPRFFTIQLPLYMARQKHCRMKNERTTAPVQMPKMMIRTTEREKKKRD